MNKLAIRILTVVLLGTLCSRSARQWLTAQWRSQDLEVEAQGV